MQIKPTVQDILQELQSNIDENKAQWLENYVKHGVRSWGVGIPKIRSIIQKLYEKPEIKGASVNELNGLLNQLMGDPYTEPKLAAILFLQLYSSKYPEWDVLALISGWFDSGWISDWNTCDWLCVRVLSPFLDQYPTKAVNTFQEWNHHPNLWKARASLVPFAQAKTIALHQQSIFDFATVLIKRPERFCKTAVGWVLREYSKIELPAIKTFLDKHKEYTTPEVLRNALKYHTDK